MPHRCTETPTITKAIKSDAPCVPYFPLNKVSHSKVTSVSFVELNVCSRVAALTGPPQQPFSGFRLISCMFLRIRASSQSVSSLDCLPFHWTHTITTGHSASDTRTIRCLMGPDDTEIKDRTYSSRSSRSLKSVFGQ